MREPLAHPGKVIRRSRGSIKEQLAALPPDRPKARKQGKAEEADPASARGGADVVNKATTAKPKSRPLPRPSRKSLEEAEKRLEVLIGRQREDDDDLRAREKVLADRRRDLEQVQARERNDAKQAVERERVAHSRAVSLWLEKQANAPP